MVFHFRLKEIKIAGLFLIIYSFIITFHLIRLLEEKHMKELRENVKQTKLHLKSRRTVGDKNQNQMNKTNLLDAVLMKVLLNQNQDMISWSHEVKTFKAGVKESNRKRRRFSRFLDKETKMFAASPPGHMGVPVHIDPRSLNPHDKALYYKGWEHHRFNQFVSDKIPVNRELPDLRHPKCRQLTYELSMPKMSVIICFHNEAWTTLLRTVHSVLKRTPPNLLKEIILVDDSSTMEHLQTNLTNYVARLPKVKIIRLKKRAGLVTARLTGTAAARAEVITFLDSHCECLPGWSQPLVARVHKDPRRVVWPIVPGIDKHTFELKHGSEKGVTQKGGFYWDMNFKWVPLTSKDKKNRVDATSPVRSPTMAGGLFTINKKFFEHLGTYDPNFELWGSENMELSFKIWMCGGSLEIIPCSVVGHVFRDSSPMHFNHSSIIRNSQRIADVWLDEYKDIYYENIGIKMEDVVGLAPRFDLRRKLKCRSFDWYIKNIYPEVFLPSQALRKGRVHSLLMNGYCLDAGQKRLYNSPVRLTPCRSGITQFWYLTEIGELRTGYQCLDVGLDPSYRSVPMAKCHGQKGNQFWEYTKNETLRKPKLQACMTVNKDTYTVSLEVCTQHLSQKWIWRPFKS